MGESRKLSPIQNCFNNLLKLLKRDKFMENHNNSESFNSVSKKAQDEIDNTACKQYVEAAIHKLIASDLQGNEQQQMIELHYRLTEIYGDLTSAILHRKTLSKAETNALHLFWAFVTHQHPAITKDQSNKEIIKDYVLEISNCYLGLHTSFFSELITENLQTVFNVLLPDSSNDTLVFSIKFLLCFNV